MRSGFIRIFFFFSKRIRRSQLKTSRRREWKKQCERAKNYSEFLKIRILEPKSDNESEPVSSSPSLPKRPRRSHSFATLKTLYEETESPTSTPSPTRLNSMKRVGSFDQKSAKSFDDEEGDERNIVRDLGQMATDLLKSTTARLNEARHAFVSEGDTSLQYLLSGVVKRNHLTLEDLLHKNARSVAESGQHEFSAPARKLIGTYYDEVAKGLDCLAEAPTLGELPLAELQDRMTLVRKMKQNMGRTALMLSGGGAQAMYHLGTVRALIDADLYDDIKVISGTSGGSISAACCAMLTTKELFEDVCVPTVSTDFRLNGEMKKGNIRWFPPVMDMGAYWLKHRLLVDSKVRFICSSNKAHSNSDEANLLSLEIKVIPKNMRILLWRHNIC